MQIATKNPAATAATHHRAPADAPRRPHVVGIHSHRGGAGKTTLAANLAYLAARGGAKVALVDADLQAPALHVALGLDSKRVLHSVSEFVRGRCELDEVPIDLSHELGLEDPARFWFLPASADLQTTASILFDGYDVGRLNEHLRRLAGELGAELLILDTHLGINRETLLSLATADTCLVMLRADGHDQDGASVLVQIADKVGVPSCLAVPNMVPQDSDAEELAQRVGSRVGAEIAEVLPWYAEVCEFGSRSPFAARRAEHPFTAALGRIARRLAPAEARAGGDP